MKKQSSILLAHGSGGKITQELLRDLFYDHFRNPVLEEQGDSALLTAESKNLAFTTDSYVVDPIFFPGGNIGKLAVCGTINDLAVSGATPKYISAGFILEEGFSMKELESIVHSMAEEAKNAEVKIVTGDTKVVNRGKCDKIFINTSGIGMLEDQYKHITSAENVSEGDVIIINGNIGDHGIAILAARESLTIQSKVKSDCASLNGLIETIKSTGTEINFMRDATRGGIGTVLCELAIKTDLGIDLEEEKLPYDDQVLGACEIFGFDPLYLANEGKVIVVVPEKMSRFVLDSMRTHPLGRKSEIIGTISSLHKGKVVLKTQIGGTRIVDMLSGEQLPRIC